MNGTLQVDLIESTRAESLDEIIPELPDANEDVVVSFLKKNKTKESRVIIRLLLMISPRNWPRGGGPKSKSGLCDYGRVKADGILRPTKLSGRDWRRWRSRGRRR